MARALIAYMRRAEVPARSALQRAIDELDLALTLDHGYVPFESSGYLPCTLDGEDAGFDLRFREAAAELANAPSPRSGFDGHDIAISCKWGGDPREEASALIVAAALAGHFHALVQRDGDTLSTAQLLAQAKAALA